MSDRPNKITGTLSHTQLSAFLEELKAISAKPTLAQIQASAKRYGIDVSLMGAKTFRDHTFAGHLQRLASGREKSAQILDAVRGGVHALDAVEEAAASDLLDLYTSGEDVDVGSVVKIVLQLRASIEARKDRDRNDADLQRRIRESDARIQVSEQNRVIAEERAKKLEREREEWERQQRAIAEQLARAKNATAEEADAIRANVVETIDSIMGLKK